MKSYAKLLVSAVTVFVSLVATAEAGTQISTQKQQSKWNSTMSLGGLSVGSDSTANQGLGESAWGIELAGNYYFKRKVIGSLGFGVVNIKDNEEFTQRVTSSFGSRTDTAKSSVVSFPLYAEITYRSLERGETGFGFGVGAGLTHFVATQRDISDCIDCRSDKISFDGGAYLKASAIYNKSNAAVVGITARQYVSGDVKSGLLLWVELNN